MTTTLIIIVLCVFVTYLCASCTFTRRMLAFPTQSKAKHISDRTGRTIIYHGVNVSNYSKHCAPPLDSTGRGRAGHPWHGEKEIANLEAWGFNLVRYLVHWEAIEPSRGEYDEAYLDSVVSDMALYAAHGIDVIIDFHQDLFAQRYHGNGFPEWAVRDDGKPFKLQESWAMNYLQPAVRACFDNFWSNKDGLLDANVAMIQHVVERVQGIPNVIGIDVFNEPWPKGWPMTFERKELSRYYDRLKSVWVRNAFFYQYLGFEPWMSTSAGYASNVRVNNDRFKGFVYMPHYYDFFCEQGKPYKWFNKQVMKRGMNIRSYEAQEFECPMIYGEFGFPIGAKDYLKAFSDFLLLSDRHSVGWCYWSYDKLIHNDRGLLNEDGTPAANGILSKLVRIYPQRIVGHKIPYKFDGDVFTMSWKSPNGFHPGLIEIFVPAAWEVIIDTDNPCRRSGNKVFVTPYPEGCKNKVKITVKNRNGFPL